MMKRDQIADLKKHGPSGWALYLCSVGMALASLSPSSVAASPAAPGADPIGPLVSEAPFTKLEVEGTGCPLGTMLLLWDKEGVLQNMRMEFDEFEVAKTRRHKTVDHKFCEVLLNIDYPQRYGLTVSVVRMDGRAFAAEGVTALMQARLSTERQGKEDETDGDVAWTKFEAVGSWHGRFSKDIRPVAAEPLVLPCGLKRPLVFRITRSLLGNAPTLERSFITHEYIGARTEVHYKLTWRHCR